MKNSLLTTVFFLLAFFNLHLANAQSTTNCVKSDQCFDFAYSYVTNSNNTVTIKFNVTTNCNHDLSHVAFQLPNGATASSYTGPGQIENPTNNPFYSIKFDGQNGKNGAVRSFSYTVTAAQFASMTTIKAHAKAATTVGEVTFTKTGCGTGTTPPPPPATCTLAANVSGPSSVCKSTTSTYDYTTPAQAGAAYTWTVPAGWNILFGDDTNTITVEATSAAVAGNVSVTVTKAGCTSASNNKAVTIASNCGSTNNGPCNTSQPRPITGNQTPCPGSIETYCINNDRGYTSFVWDVPRAHAGNPPTGWVIISGQGTSCVTVKVGTKPGTMKVKVNDPSCGTKVATLPVHPGTAFKVEVEGPDTACANANQTYTAIISDSIKGNGNGNGHKKGEFNYTWNVPAGWVIISGQGTQTLVVKPGTTGGQVNVTVNYVPQTNGNGNGNNGNGVGNKKGYCNNTDSDGITVFVDTNCGTPCTINANITGPDTVCAYSDEAYIFSTPAQLGATYTWSVPADWFIDSGDGTNSITVYVGELSGEVTVTVTNTCGTASDMQYVYNNQECGNINPLPVHMLSFTATAANEGVVLKWATAMEKDNDHFEVQRSLDGRSFETIGTVKGNGTVNTRTDYAFTDAKAVKGLNYYRLRQVDANGASEMSKMVRVSTNGKASAAITIYPNPVTNGNFTVSLSQVSDNGSVTISDMNGRQLYSKVITSGSNELRIETSRLGMKPGMYLVTVRDNNTAITQKMIVK